MLPARIRSCPFIDTLLGGAAYFTPRGGKGLDELSRPVVAHIVADNDLVGHRSFGRARTQSRTGRVPTRSRVGMRIEISGRLVIYFGAPAGYRRDASAW